MSESLHSNANYENPAADPRKMRKIIAEDPEWTLATIPLLSELSIDHIIKGFAENPILNDLPDSHKKKLIDKLSTDVPIHITANLVTDDAYWKRCCKSKWKVCDVSEYGKNWRRMYFEKQLEESIEGFTPGMSSMTVVDTFLKLAGKYIYRMIIRELLPPVRELPKDGSDNDSDGGSDIIEDIEYTSHFDFNLIADKLPNLEEFYVTYGVRNINMNFDFQMFLFTSVDCMKLGKFIQSSKKIRKFGITRSNVDDKKSRLLIKYLLNHPNLESIDFSYNIIGDRGARAFGKIVNCCSYLTSLNLLDNRISSEGAAAIAHALSRNSTLRFLNLRLNKLRNEGAQSICQALLENNTLEEINLAANEITEQSASYLAKVIATNATLSVIDISCNKIGADGGKQIQEAMESNETITKFELKLTDCGQESEYCINRIIDSNLRNKSQHIEDRLLATPNPVIVRRY